MAVMVVCALGSSTATVYFDGGIADLDTAEVAGAATRDTLTGAWTYGNTTWSALDLGGGTPSNDCAGNGADTASVASDFYHLNESVLSGLFSNSPKFGDHLMLFRETTFTFQTSEMDSTTVGLFRKPYGHDAVEYATGMDTTSQFQYKVGSVYGDTLPSFFLGFIDAIRIVVEARKRSETGGVDDVMFGWSVNIALRNLR